MKLNVNHPSFIKFIENVGNTVLSNITTNDYFKLSPEKKLGIQYIVFKLLKKSITIRATLSDLELKSFLLVLIKRNEEIENYEFSGILNDILKNYDHVTEETKSKKINKVNVEKNKNV